MSLVIPQKKTKGGTGEENTHLSGTCLPNGACSSVDSKHPFTKAFRKDDSIWGSQGENHCSWKSGKRFLARPNCE